MFTSRGGLGGVHGAGASGKCMGQSESGRGRSSSSSSNEPAQASRLVRKELRLNSDLAVEQIEESSNWEVRVGPCKTVQFGKGEMEGITYQIQQKRATAWLRCF